jgi:hypothetical protein
MSSLSALPLGDAAEIERRVAVEQQIRQLDERLVAASAVPEPQRALTVATIEPLVMAAEAAVARLASSRVDLEGLSRAELDDDLT